jgi:hypothetical protein
MEAFVLTIDTRKQRTWLMRSMRGPFIFEYRHDGSARLRDAVAFFSRAYEHLDRQSSGLDATPEGRAYVRRL